MARVLLVALLLCVVGSLAAPIPFVSWNIQEGNGCAVSKTIATYYFPLTPTCLGNDSFSYSYSCVGGSPVNSSYNGVLCAGTAIAAVQMPTNCENNGTFGYYYACVELQDTLAKDERRLIQYAAADCTGDALYYVSAKQGACVSAFSTSFKLACSGDKAIRSSYDSADCTGPANDTESADGGCLNGLRISCSSSVALTVSIAVLIAFALFMLLL